MKPDKSSSLIGILLLVAVLSSCMTMSPLKETSTKRMAGQLKANDMVSLTLQNGAKIDKIVVRKVWTDSLLLGSDIRAVKISDIVEIRKRKVNAGLTAAALTVPLILFVMIKNSKFGFGPYH